MPDLAQTILTEIGNDLSIETRNLCVDVQERGVFRRKRLLHIWGTVHSEDQVDKVEGIARRYAGNSYEIVNHLSTKPPLV